MDVPETPMRHLKDKARHELIEYAVNVVYLILVFEAFTLDRRLVLAAYDITYTNYVSPLSKHWFSARSS